MGENDIRARSFVAIMIVIAIFTLLLRITVSKIIRINITQNEANAQETLKLISTALENYSKDSQGAFPTSISTLLKNQPAYLDKDYIAVSPAKGYNFSCLRLEATGYSCCATPVFCNLSGKLTFTITTSGLLVSEECSKKEKSESD